MVSLTDDGHWQYRLHIADVVLGALGGHETRTDTFTVTAKDGTTETIAITLEGVNDPAVFSGDLAANLSEDGDAVAGQLSVSDVDGDTPLKDGTGTYGKLTLNERVSGLMCLPMRARQLAILILWSIQTDTFTVKALMVPLNHYP